MGRPGCDSTSVSSGGHRSMSRSTPRCTLVVVDQVVVVDHDDEPLVVVDQCVHERRHDDTIVALGADDRAASRERRDARARSADRGDERRPEASGIGVAVLDLQPRHRLRLASGPRGEQRRLPRAGRRAAPAPAEHGGRCRRRGSTSSRVRSTSRVGGAGGRSLVAAIPNSWSSGHFGDPTAAKSPG